MRSIATDKHALHATADVWVNGARLAYCEVPARVNVILAALQSAGLGPVLSPSDYGLAPILAVHDAGFVAHLRTSYAGSAARFGVAAPVLAAREGITPTRPATPPDDFVERALYYTFDCEDPILAGTWEAAYWSAQCALTAAVLVQQGERAAYALCRPPGHHATADQHGGFCYLNNIACAARYLTHTGPVAILDIDYHHGNGTQAIFYTDPRVLYCSLHADPDADYPYFWGRASEQGTGLGFGTNLNLPLPLHIGDTLYLRTLETALARIVDFRPRYLLVSLGLDIAAGDPIGKFDITPGGLQAIGESIAALDIPTILAQEGGYNLATLGANVVKVLQAFA